MEKTLMASDVKRMFTSFLEVMPQEKFYMCSDENAVEWLERVLGIEGIDLSAPRGTQVDSILK